MKKTISQIHNHDIEFDIPCYIKFGENHFYKIMNLIEVVIVQTYSFNTSIRVEHLDQVDPFGNNGWEFTTQEEFKKAFDIALEKISTLTEFPNLQSTPV